jgi:hypothetical protein
VSDPCPIRRVVDALLLLGYSEPHLIEHDATMSDDPGDPPRIEVAEWLAGGASLSVTLEDADCTIYAACEDSTHQHLDARPFRADDTAAIVAWCVSVTS